MEDDKISKMKYNNLVISIFFTMAYGILLGGYSDLPLNGIKNSHIIVFIVCSLVFAAGALFFAFKSYKTVKVGSVVLIILNSLGLLIPLVLLLMIFA